MSDFFCSVRRFMLAAVTPLLEKNPSKTTSLKVPLVFSMSRVIVLAFAVSTLRQIWRAGVWGWPDATLSIAVVLALPILGALERAKPADVLDVAKTLLARVGVGDTRPAKTGSVFADYGQEPSKYDDHGDDA